MPESAQLRKCPVCGETLVPVEAALNRPFWRLLSPSRGSARLQIRLRGGDWKTHMTLHQSAEGLYCCGCGSLTIAPTLPEHRRALGLD